MRVRLKVCCIASAREARLAVRFGADAVGLVAAMPSGPGPIPDHDIAAISREVPPPVARFLLTSETEPDAVLAHVTACGTDTVQLVDRVPDATHRALRERLPGVRVVQVIHVEDDTALAEAARVAPMVHALLLDSGRPSHPTRELGGTGRAHDWRISRTIVDLPRRSGWSAPTASTCAAGSAPQACWTRRNSGASSARWRSRPPAVQILDQESHFIRSLNSGPGRMCR
jgi:phosphoribosylanthranilate isomerase